MKSPLLSALLSSPCTPATTRTQTQDRRFFLFFRIGYTGVGESNDKGKTLLRKDVLMVGEVLEDGFVIVTIAEEKKTPSSGKDRPGHLQAWLLKRKKVVLLFCCLVLCLCLFWFAHCRC